MPEQQLIETTRNSLPSLSSRVMFWRPRFMADSQWLEHIPFYFWLAEAQQPRLVFEPDMTTGSTYFALCQAVDKLNIDTRCIAGFNTQCQQQEKIEEYNDDNYQEFSIISPEDALDSIEDIEDGTLDLLVLKYNSPLIVDKKLIDGWEKKLSDRAIVLVHGSRKKEIKPLCRTLKKTYNNFEFVHGNGLLVVATGEQQTAKIQSLMSLGGNHTGTRIMQDVYSRLGVACRESWFSTNSKKQIKALDKQLKETADNLSSKEQKNKQLSQSLEKVIAERKTTLQQKEQLESNVELRFEELAKLTKLLQQTEITCQQLTEEKATLSHKVGQLQAAGEKYEKQFKDLLKKNEDLENSLKQAQKNYSQTSGVASKKYINENEQLKKELKLLKNKLQTEQQLSVMLERDQKVAAEKISELKKSESNLKESLEERFNELAILTKILTETENKKESKELIVKDPIENKSTDLENDQLSIDIKRIRESSLFDEQWYKSQNPEAVKHKYGAVGHYLEFGVDLSINPSKGFDGNWYLETNQDVKDAGVNPLLHYINFGREEKRMIMSKQ